MQALLDSWNQTGLESCTTSAELYELCWNPTIAFDEGVMRLKAIPEGLTPEQEKDYEQRLKIPSGTEFFNASESARQDPYVYREMSAFTIKDSKVILGPGSQKLIKAKIVFASSKQQETLGKAILKLVTDYNKLNEQTGTRLSGIFGGVDKVLIKPETLQELIDRV